MALSEHSQQLLAMLSNLPALDYPHVEASTLRAMLDNPISSGETVYHSEDLILDGSTGPLKVRRYQPHGDGPWPTWLYFHGGGYVIGTLDTHDTLCRTLCNRLQIQIFSLEYRLAPETRFPGAIDDAWDALHALHAGRDRFGIAGDGVAIAGDSAGGGLAAALAQRSRDQQGPTIVHQYLFYPMLQARFDTDSYQAFAEGFFLTQVQMQWFWQQYLGDSPQPHPWAQPLSAEQFGNLPPATVITAEYDPLRDEGEAYALAMAQAGVPVLLQRSLGNLHGFMSMADAATMDGVVKLLKPTI